MSGQLLSSTTLRVIIGKRMYRVSINSFPDYKDLLQENYVEYKYFFFQNVTKSKKFVYDTSVHFNMCSFCCTENV